MAKETLTSKIFDNIAAGFADVQKDITKAKKAIEAAGVPSSGTTKNLSEEIAKIQTKVTDVIKSTGEIRGLNNGTLDMTGGFIFHNSYNYMKADNTEILSNKIDYVVPDNMMYQMTWPTNSAITNDRVLLMDLKNSSDPIVASIYGNLEKPLIKLHFSKNNTNRLGNTGFGQDITDFKTDVYRGSDFDLEVHLTDDRITTDTKVDQTTIDTFHLEKSGVTTDDNVIHFDISTSLPEENQLSVPKYDCKWYINNNLIGNSIAIADHFVAGHYGKLKAVICKSVQINGLYLVAGFAHSKREDGLEYDPASGGYQTVTYDHTKTDVYIDAETLVIDGYGPTNPTFTYPDPSEWLCLVRENIKDPLMNILVKKTDAMTDSIIVNIKKLAYLDIDVYTYDRSEIFDFNSMKWINSADLVDETRSWVNWLPVNNRAIDPPFVYVNALASMVQRLKNRFDITADGSDRVKLDITDWNNISFFEDIVNNAKADNANFYKLDGAYGIRKSTTIFFQNPNYTWKLNKRLEMCEQDFPKFFAAGFDINAAPEVDGKHTITLDLSVMPGPLYSSQEFPLSGLYVETGDTGRVDIVLSATDGSHLSNNDIDMLNANSEFRYLTVSKTPIEHVVIDRTSQNIEESNIVPIIYNRHIKDMELTNCRIGKCITQGSAMTILNITDNDLYFKTPAQPMVIKLHNCKFGDIIDGPYKDRTNENDRYTPDAYVTEYAKFINVLVEENDTIVNDQKFRFLRLPLYTMDKSKKYNYKKQVWEEIANVTPDEFDPKPIGAFSSEPGNGPVGG